MGIPLRRAGKLRPGCKALWTFHKHECWEQTSQMDKVGNGNMAQKLDVERIENARQKKTPGEAREIERARLREAMEGNRRGERRMTVISPTQADRSTDTMPLLRVAAYCRVSTAEEAQVGSFEMQIQHFTDVIQANPRYAFVKIFTDEGLSGTSMDKRKGFQEMIEAARSGRIDLILTKSITRFGRNIVDILSTLRLLESLNPPVAVNFETDGIDTSDGKHKLLISILSALAELESQQKSEAVKAGIRYRMREGIYRFSVHNTLGYYRDYAGAVKIEPAEAEIVRYIYDGVLEGASPQAIANALMEQGITSPKGRTSWRVETIRGIIKNEKYCGDVLYQKTFIKDFLTHKAVKNRNMLVQYRWENCHPAIILREEWERAQELLSTKNWNQNGAKPARMTQRFVVTKVKSGPLRGYYLIDSTWEKAERAQFIHILTAKFNRLESGLK